MPLLLAQALQLVMQLVNTVEAVTDVAGSAFSTMLILEYVLVHGQGLLLILALFMDKRFTKLLTGICEHLLPWLFEEEPERVQEPSYPPWMTQSIRHCMPVMSAPSRTVGCFAPTECGSVAV
mmetsp:Transcript_1112/g.3932  ORF Transcript_1112/g.3932 Transcript_1112/m.3932 type:complete len:122 (+) Transcript_1112:235-600(+)